MQRKIHQNLWDFSEATLGENIIKQLHVFIKDGKLLNQKFFLKTSQNKPKPQRNRGNQEWEINKDKSSNKHNRN